MESIVTNENCMDLMARYPDKYFDLAVVDPPYGSVNADWENKKNGRFGGRFSKYKLERDGGTWSKKYDRKIKTWDIAPDENYFLELFRVSKYAIVWGGNYFALPPSNNFLIWRKLTISETFSMAMVEYAWTNIKGNAKWIEIPPQDKKRFHPTQKPVALYDWIFKNYAKDGDKILDTHLGSGSSRISAHKAGLYFVGCELDKEYFDASVKRYEDYIKQQTLFNPKELNKLAL